MTRNLRYLSQKLVSFFFFRHTHTHTCGGWNDTFLNAIWMINCYESRLFVLIIMQIYASSCFVTCGMDMREIWNRTKKEPDMTRNGTLRHDTQHFWHRRPHLRRFYGPSFTWVSQLTLARRIFFFLLSPHFKLIKRP